MIDLGDLPNPASRHTDVIDQHLPQFVNPAHVELYPSCLQELSKTHFPTSPSGFVTTPPETFQFSNDIHTLSYDDMSPAEILASIPQYNSETVPMPTANSGLEDKLFPSEDIATSNLNSPGSTVEQVGNNQPNDGLPQINAITNIPDISKNHSRTAGLYSSESEKNQLLSSTPISDPTNAFSSEVSSSIMSYSSYSDKSVEQGSTEAINSRDSSPLSESNNEAKHSVANDEEESLGYNCFCGGVDDDMMIACEGNHGEFELWFHYHCADIDVVPDGQ